MTGESDRKMSPRGLRGVAVECSALRLKGPGFETHHRHNLNPPTEIWRETDLSAQRMTEK